MALLESMIMTIGVYTDKRIGLALSLLIVSLTEKKAHPRCACFIGYADSVVVRLYIPGCNDLE